MEIGYTADNRLIIVNADQPLCKDAIEIFKTYGIIKDGYVYLEKYNLYMAPDQNRVISFKGLKPLKPLKPKEKIKKREKQRCLKRPSFIKADKNLICIVTGLNIYPGDDYIKTAEGHSYSRQGILILFAGNQKKVKSPYKGAIDLVRPYLTTSK